MEKNNILFVADNKNGGAGVRSALALHVNPEAGLVEKLNMFSIKNGTLFEQESPYIDFEQDVIKQVRTIWEKFCNESKILSIKEHVNLYCILPSQAIVAACLQNLITQSVYKRQISVYLPIFKTADGSVKVINTVSLAATANAGKQYRSEGKRITSRFYINEDYINLVVENDKVLPLSAFDKEYTLAAPEKEGGDKRILLTMKNGQYGVSYSIKSDSLIVFPHKNAEGVVQQTKRYNAFMDKADTFGIEMAANAMGLPVQLFEIINEETTTVDESAN